VVKLLELAPMEEETGADGIFFLNCCFCFSKYELAWENMFVFINGSAVALIGHRNGIAAK
jgi:hypothetical protein